MSSHEQIRLTVNLSDCMLEDTVWSHRFDGPIKDVFAIQNETIAVIVGALEPALFRREEEVVAQPEPRTMAQLASVHPRSLAFLAIDLSKRQRRSGLPD